LRNALDTTVKTPEELELSIGLPSLGVVPTIRQLKTVEQASPADGQLAVPDFEPRDPALIPYRNMLSRVWEPYRALRTAIMMSHSDSPPRVILVTSAIPGEGKSVTSANLGIVLAKTGSRTLLMDLDMRKPRLSEMFGASRQRGMSVYLSGNSEKVSDIVDTAVTNLCLVSSGKTPPNSSELVGSRRMKEAIDAMRGEFEFVIIDSPPVMACTDAVVLSRQVDGVVLVVRGGHTPRKAVEEVAIRITNAGGKILGVIMNDVDIAKPEYSYYYGSYYQHYHQYYGSDTKNNG
jgi:polysaccharide biosynthesis transport protein